MDEADEPLLDNMLMALDRLFDRESSARDVQALAQATAAAVSSPDMRELLADAAT